MADDALTAAIENARNNPSDEDAWDSLEDLAADSQSPDEVAELYREVVSGDIDAALAATLGQRAMNFLEEWFGEDSPLLVQILDTVLGKDPSAEWAFQRLTVVHTAAGRFDDLLALYDRALAAAEDDGARAALLDEAANVAKDFAGDSVRAIGYMQQLLPLKPKDKGLASSLERLLEKEGQWTDLIAFWNGRLGNLKKKADVHAMHERIAGCYLDQLGQPGDALAELKKLLEAGGGGDGVIAVLERIGSSEAADDAVRTDALELLKDQYEAAGRTEDVVRILGDALELAGTEERIALHREAAQQHESAGQLEDAFGHFEKLIALDPSAQDALESLRTWADSLDAHLRFAEALTAAASASEAAAPRIALRVEAADVRRTRLAQVEESIGLYQLVLGEDEAEEGVVLKVARRLNDLLATAGRIEERLTVLERLATLEPEAADRRAIVGQVARAADELGDVDRALSSWQRRLAEDEKDLEALDAMVEVLLREERWSELVTVLGQRAAAAPVPFRRRADLVRVAKVQREELSNIEGAIATWSKVAEEFGEDPETVDALAELLSTAERWDDVSDLLGRAADREADHVASIYARIGDVQREQMGELAHATEAYASALRIDPGFAAARQGLGQLLDVPELRGPAAESLASAYGLTDEWQQQLELLAYRLESADNNIVKVRLYREAAKIQEERAEDLAASLTSMRHAMALAPELRDIEADVFRLAEATSQWSIAIDAIRDAVEALGEEAPRSRYLRFWEGRLVEEHLGDSEAALAAFGKVFDGEPTRADAAVAVVRTAGKSGRWGRAAEALVKASRAKKSIPEEVMDAVESAAGESSAWGEIASALEGSVGSADGIEPRLARELEVLAARWHESRREDVDSAQAAYVRAVAHDDTDLPTLNQLARLQRRSGGRPLYDTLMRMADLVEDDLDPLREATEIALNGSDDGSLGRSTAERLYREGTRLWRRGATTGGEAQPEPSTRWALDQLVSVHERDESPARAVSLLADAALLPVGAETSLEWRRRAADIATASGDNARAIVLYRGILDETPNDTGVLGALAAVCEQEDRLPEMMALLSHELGLTEESDRRLQIRLDLARLVGEFERRGGRVEALEANLQEQPGHEPSIEALIEVLEGGRRYGQLADILTDQATRLETEGEAKRAARLWTKVASLGEDRLEDVDRALDAHRKVVELAATAKALDALARLHTDRGQHAAAAQWLERRLSVAEDEERTDVAVSLANAHLGAGQIERAINVLEQALEGAPERSDVRDMLAAQYRATDATEPLAALLTTAGAYVEDDETLLAYAREASDLFAAIDQPDRAIPVLERAAARAEKDRDIRTRLAEGLLRGDRHDEAAEILAEVIKSYGRRRNAERAASHHQLARVNKARGDMEAALEQLELASKMDVSNPVILRALGEMSHDAGEHDRAERAYRALLLIVRRQKPEELKVGASEVQYELGRIAKARGDEEAAEELFESALETATSNDVEAERLERTLVQHGEHELALRALEGRLESAKEDASRARLLGRVGALLDEHLDRSADGLARLLEALDHAPTDDDLHAATRGLAKRAEQSDAYSKKLTALAKAADAPADESDLLLRLGEVVELDLEKAKRAKKHYAKVESLGVHVALAWKALARAASTLGDTDEELRVLTQLVSSGEEVATPAERVDAMFRLAEVQLERDEHRDAGVETMTQALDYEPRNSIAAGVLKMTSDGAPEHTGVLRVYERVARGSGEPLYLLDFFEKRAKKEDATLGEVREGVELATEHEAADRAENLLERAAEIARGADDGLAGALWVPTQLAQLRRAAGDMSGAIRWYNEAADAAGEERGFELRIEAATLAAEEGSLDLAAEALETLLPRDPQDQRVWEPLLEVHRKRGDEDRLNDIVSSTVDALLDPSLRNKARMQKALFLLEREGREPDAADALREVLDEEPEHMEAGRMLADLFEKTGYDEDLVDLLSRQLDIARDNSDHEQIRELTLRLGGILEKVRREDAMDVYRRGLDWLSEDRDIAQALLAQLGPDDDPRERIEVLEKLLATETGEAAAKLSMDLAAEWERLEEPDGVQRALELGYRGCPENDDIRGRLEAWYLERELTEPLAAFKRNEAARLGDASVSVPLLREAAATYRDVLGDASSAAASLAEARAFAPDDVVLLSELVQARVAASDYQTATDEVAAAIEDGLGGSESRVTLLRLRASLSLATGDQEAAIADLEDAYESGGAEVGPDLVEALRARRESAAAGGNTDGERGATLRLVQVLSEIGESLEARDILADHVSRAPGDREALYLLRDVDERAERWPELADTCARLIEAEEGDDQVDAALRLAHAWTQAGEPGAARGGLEYVANAQPDSIVVRNRLRELYEQAGAHAELGNLLMADVQGTEDPEERYELLRKAGDMFLRAGDGAAAITPLEQAVQLKPDDHGGVVLLVDGYIAGERYADAGQMLEQAIANHTRRRSPELAQLQSRMARLAAAAGDPSLQLQWLNAAMDSDKSNGTIAAELAQLAMQLNDHDTALNALRVVTLNKTEGPMSRAMAFLLQARIAHERGEARRALLWARKARSEDPELTEAEEFLRQIGEG